MRTNVKSPSLSKMKLGSIMSNVRKSVAGGAAGTGRRDSTSLESTKSNTPSGSVAGAKEPVSGASSAASRKFSDKEKKKTGGSLSKFKSGLLGKNKKKIDKEKEVEVSSGKDLKPRLFFREVFSNEIIHIYTVGLQGPMGPSTLAPAGSCSN